MGLGVHISPQSAENETSKKDSQRSKGGEGRG